MNNNQLMNGFLVLSGSLEKSLHELVGLFSGTTVSLWKAAVDKYHRDRIVDKSATAIQWVQLARQSKLHILYDDAGDLVVLIERRK